MKALIIQTWSSSIKQIKELQGFTIMVYTFPIILLLIILFFSLQFSIPVSVYMKDPVSVAKLPFYTGLISNAGVLFWFATFLICSFTFLINRNTNGGNKNASFFIYFGGLALLLMLDDLLLLHEQVFPDYLNTSEKIIYLTYMIIFAGGLLIYHKIILSTNFLLLFLGTGFLGLSIVVDMFQERIEDKIGQYRIFFEDGFKFIGIVGWFGYFFNCASIRISGLINKGIEKDG